MCTSWSDILLRPVEPNMLVSFKDLPTELVEHISSYLDLPTFRSLRLTCSSCSTQTIHIFKSRFFTTQCLQWTELSLQRLANISAHDDFGDALRFLVINATPIYSLRLWQMRRRSSDAGHFTPIPNDPDGSQFIHHLNHEYTKMEEEASEVTRWFNESRFDIKCLATVFQRLPTLESIMFLYESMEPKYSMFSRKYCEASQHEMSRPFVSTLSAIAASGIHVKSIKLDTQHSHGAVSIGRLESLAPSLLALSPILSSLSTLHLNLRDWRSPDSGFELERARAPFVVRFLAKCRNVKVLELNCFSEMEEDLFGEMARTCRFEKLERCKLSLFQIRSAKDLLSFFIPSSTSMRELKLHQILLADEESTWEDLFSDLAISTSCLEAMEVLEVKNLFTRWGTRLCFYARNRAAYSVRAEGDTWRAGVKNGMCRYVESEKGPDWEQGAVEYPFNALRA